MRVSVLFAFLLLSVWMCFAPGVLYAQEGEDTEPVPYEADEFADWLQPIRRFEIIAIGSFPLTYLLTLLTYDISRFVVESVRIGAFNSLYAPLFFAPPNKPAYTQEETVGLILAAVGLSLVVAIIDLIIQQTKRSRARERIERLDAAEEARRADRIRRAEESERAAEPVEATGDN